MKNTALKILLGMTIISSLFLCLLLYVLFQKGRGDGEGVSQLKEYQERYDKLLVDTKTIVPEVYRDFSDQENMDELYDIARHTDVYERIEALKRDGGYTKDEPLVIYNPYGVNAHSVYVYFTTEQPMKVSYRVGVSKEGITTFTAQCNSGEMYTTVHEYLLIGLIADENNRISLALEDAEGNSCIRNFYVTAGSRFGIGNERLDVSRGVSEEELSDGLFAHFGNRTGSREAVQLYDNEGILRSEFPLLEGSAKRFIFYDDKLLFNISDTQFAVMDAFGRVEQVYSVKGYTIGKDFCLDTTAMRLLVLASKVSAEGKIYSVNDRLLSVDLFSGETKELLDMGAHLGEYKDICEADEEGVLDWLGLNSVQILNGTGVLLGAREPSAAFKVEDIYGLPMISYIIGEATMFAGTGYENLLLFKTDDFAAFAGANTFTCVKEERMPSGVYELYLYDNHIAGTASRPEFDYSEDWEDLGSSLKKGTASYYCRYLVNETARSWELLECVPVEYSGYEGSAQIFGDGHLIADTAGRFAYSEYDENRTLIRKYTAAGTKYLERVFKYDFQGFFFAEDSGNASVKTEPEK